MTKPEFRKMELKLDSIGKVFQIDNTEYHFTGFISYAWITHCTRPNTGADKGYTEHPNPKKKGHHGLLAFDKIIVEKFDDIDLNIEVTGYFSVGPTGVYADVIGNIGNIQINASAHRGGTAQWYNPIESIYLGKHLFYIDYSLSAFLLAVFKVKDF
jgi:hypothetical protein